MNIIFAVTNRSKELYEQLVGSITGASTGVLDEDSSNVVSLIEAEYAVCT